MADVSGGQGAGGQGAMRLDRFLWWVRLAKTRSVAQGIAADGRMRIDGRAVDRAHAAVRVGNVLTFACNGRVRVIRVEALPHRRGPAPEAQGCYADLAPPPIAPASPIATQSLAED